jgi:SNF2 family DNA or RNA helicase
MSDASHEATHHLGLNFCLNAVEHIKSSVIRIAKKWHDLLDRMVKSTNVRNPPLRTVPNVHERIGDHPQKTVVLNIEVLCRMIVG